MRSTSTCLQGEGRCSISDCDQTRWTCERWWRTERVSSASSFRALLTGVPFSPESLPHMHQSCLSALASTSTTWNSSKRNPSYRNCWAWAISKAWWIRYRFRHAFLCHHMCISLGQRARSRGQRGADRAVETWTVYAARHVRAVPKHHEDGSLLTNHGVYVLA